MNKRSNKIITQYEKSACEIKYYYFLRFVQIKNNIFIKDVSQNIKIYL